MITRTQLLAKIRELGPFVDEAAAERALNAALGTLGEQLTSDELTWLSRELDDALFRMVAAWSKQGGELAPQRSEHDFVQRMAAREAVWTGLATEHAQVVLGALGLLLPATVVRLERHLPELAALFEWRVRSASDASVRHARPEVAHDLAEGRPGGTRPLASADPQTLAHRHSVARSDDPHADTKLSSARGLTQEREGHTLASGHPGANNPISRGH